MKRRLFMAGAALYAAAGARGMWREGDHPALPRPARPVPTPVIDPVPDFAQAYAQAGRPTIALLWGRRFSDRTHTALEDRSTVTESSRKRRDGVDKNSQGPAETARLTEEDERSDRRRTTISGTYAVADPDDGRGAAPVSRHAAMIEQAFLGEMQRAGVRFIDRAVAMRTTAASRHRDGGDRQLIETDALLATAQLLMEVQWVPDKDAPAWHAFDVRTKRLRDGLEVDAVYSRGAPSAPPRGQPQWVAGNQGYELRAPPPPATPTPAQVGRALAHDVMQGLAPQLAREAASSRRRP